MKKLGMNLFVMLFLFASCGTKNNEPPLVNANEVSTALTTFLDAQPINEFEYIISGENITEVLDGSIMPKEVVVDKNQHVKYDTLSGIVYYKVNDEERAYRSEFFPTSATNSTETTEKDVQELTGEQLVIQHADTFRQQQLDELEHIVKLLTTDTSVQFRKNETGGEKCYTRGIVNSETNEKMHTEICFTKYNMLFINWNEVGKNESFNLRFKTTTEEIIAFPINN